jgi:PAS domain S-box-containing protein
MIRWAEKDRKRVFLVFVASVVLSATTLLLRQALAPAFGQRPLLILFVFPTILSAYVGGLWAGLAATAASSLLVAYTVFPPLGSLRIGDPHDAFQWLLFVLSGILISVLSQAMRREADSRRRLEARFAAVFERSNEFITLRDEKGGLLYASPTVERLLGLDRQTLLREGFGHAIHPDDRELALEQFRSLQRGQALNDLRMRVRAADGSWHWLEGSVTHLLDDPEVGAVVSNFKDVTERVALEHALAQANKMESIGRMAGGIAHDFNNLLTIVIGEADLALGHPGLPPEAAEALQAISGASERAAELTGQLMAFARKSLTRPKVLDLREVLRGAEPMLRRLLGEPVEIKLFLPPALGRVKADPRQIEQVLINLAVNARDAMPEGGKLTLEVADIRIDADYAKAHAGVPTGAYVMLAVSDTGVGIDPTVLPSIFEPFFTTKELGRGTGLGLATCHGIIKQAGGHIFAYSEPGHGSSFKVYLPLTEEELAIVPPAMPLPAPSPGRAERILLVEDEVSLRALAARVLRQAGYQVLEAGNGVEGLALAGQESFELLVTDLVMPAMGGRELADRLSASRPGLKVLFLSGYTENAILHQGTLADSVQFLAKPFLPAALSQKVREVLDKQA